MYTDVAELEKLAEMDGCEWGETAVALARLWYMRTLLSNSMLATLEQEIKDWLEDVQTNAHIVTETIESKPITVESLEWY